MTRLMMTCAALALLAACSSGTEIEPGAWEMTMEIDEVNVPNAPPEAQAQIASGMPTPPAQTICITPEEARDPDGGMFAPSNEGGCEFAEREMSGGNISLDATCSGAQFGPAEAHITMNGTYERTSFETDLEMEMTMPDPVGEITMSGTVRAEHKSDEC
ncbi:MAG: DUF3617 domain-containing protein [Sphingomonadaceae bacterium]|nr:DUF3617 domain-containing protein [Sphingomonadaceae bacterium]